MPFSHFHKTNKRHAESMSFAVRVFNNNRVDEVRDLVSKYICMHDDYQALLHAYIEVHSERDKLKAENEFLLKQINDRENQSI